MSAYENVVGGKLKLKGKALDVKAGGVKKKKKHREHYEQISQVSESDLATGFGIQSQLKKMGLFTSIQFPSCHNERLITWPGASTEMSADLHQDDVNDGNKSTEEGNAASYDGHLTPAQRRYMEQKEKIDVHRLAKTANKSHRDRIEDFNQYLANMSEHYDIPKVGPG